MKFEFIRSIAMPYILAGLVFSAVLLSLNQVMHLLDFSDTLVFLVYTNLMVLNLFIYSRHIIPKMVSKLRWCVSLFVFVPCSVFLITYIGLGIIYLIYSNMVNTEILPIYRADQYALVLLGVQFCWFLALFIRQRLQHRYQDLLKSAGVNADLEHALFRVTAGYVGKNFIAKTLKNVAEQAESSNEQAIKMVEDLGQLMRFALETSQKPAIKLSDEVQVLSIFCGLYNQLVFRTRSQLTLQVRAQAENHVLPMAIYGLIAYVLSKLDEEVELDERWLLSVILENGSGTLICSIVCQAMTPSAEDEKEKLVIKLNDPVIDSMRFRLEQGYYRGSFIELKCEGDIVFRLSVPYSNSGTSEYESN